MTDRRVELVDPTDADLMMARRKKITSYRIQETRAHGPGCKPGCEGCGPTLQYRLARVRRLGWTFDGWIKSQSDALQSDQIPLKES